jgi:hypothetical protein
MGNQMNYQHIENLLIRFRSRSITIKTTSGALYEGTITDVTNDYVTLKTKKEGAEDDLVIVLLHSIESLLPHPE